MRKNGRLNVHSALTQRQVLGNSDRSLALSAAPSICSKMKLHAASQKAKVLGDATTYGISLAVIGTSIQIRARAAILKALSLTAMALWVLGSTAYHVLVLGIPRAEIMGAVGILALAANVASVLILMRYKDGDANVRSVWLCSRNDAIGNVAVMAAALAVWGTATKWPDLLVAAIMAGLFLTSSIQILRQSFREMREGRAVPAE